MSNCIVKLLCFVVPLFAITAAAVGQSVPSKGTLSAPQGKEFILIAHDAPLIDTIAACDSKVIFGKVSKLIRDIFPQECGAKSDESELIDKPGKGERSTPLAQQSKSGREQQHHPPECNF
jgi:hypothetical protein